HLVAVEFPYFAQGDVELLVPETYGDEIIPTPGQRPPTPTIEDLLSSHPEAGALHEKIRAVLPDCYAGSKGVSYRGLVNGAPGLSHQPLHAGATRLFPGFPACDKCYGRQ